MKRTALCAFVVLAMSRTAAADECHKPPATYQDYFCAIAEEIYTGLNQTAGQPTFGVDEIQQAIQVQTGNLGAFLLYAQARAQGDAMRAVESARVDKQVGSPGNAPGSGSAVSKGSVPAILGFAVENGALSQDVSATTVTLRGNAIGWLDLVRNQGFIGGYQDDAWTVRQLRRLSYSFTLNTSTTTTPSSGSPLAALTPAGLQDQLRQTEQQLAGYSVRVAILDRRNPRTAANRRAVAATLGPVLRDAMKSDNFLNPVFESPDYNQRWITETAQMLSLSRTRAGIERTLYRQMEALRLLMVNRIDHFDDRVARALAAYDAYDSARLKMFQTMQKQPLAAVEYVAARHDNLPDQSTVRGIFEGQLNARMDLTGNVAWTYQQSGTSGATTVTSGWRDFQAAAELAIPLGDIAKSLAPGSGIGAPVFSVAYLGENLKDKTTVSFGGNTFTPDAGWIHLLQAKVTLPVKGSGIKIPFSMSFANRTELVKEHNVRGHIGVTFDLDALTGLRP